MYEKHPLQAKEEGGWLRATWPVPAHSHHHHHSPSFGTLGSTAGEVGDLYPERNKDRFSWYPDYCWTAPHSLKPPETT